jgi:hypothetical protein
MTKTIVVDDRKRAALLFVLGGRHHMQLEPHHLAALDDVEAELRDVPTEAESVVAPSEVGTVSPPEEVVVGPATVFAAPATKPKRPRGRR